METQTAQDQSTFQPPPQAEVPLSSEPTDVQFEPIEGAFTPEPSPETTVVVTPYTNEQITAGATVVANVVGARMKLFFNDQERIVFNQYLGSFLPLGIGELQLGEALAAYGIGQREGMTGLNKLPPLLRLALGAGFLAVGVYLGGAAVQENRNQKTEEA